MAEDKEAVNQAKRKVYEEVAKMARQEADFLAPPRVGVGVIEAGGAIHLRKFAEKLEKKARRIQQW